MEIAVVGAGWYGCHIAKRLIDLGEEVTIYESANEIFSGASGNNQSRLHLGFHYPRCSFTRDESIKSYNEFMTQYYGLTRNVPSNVYAIAADASLIDWPTYRDIMMAQGLTFLDVYPEDYGLQNISGAMLTGERVILQDKAKEYFQKALWNNLRLGDSIKSIENLSVGYDYTIDCTFGSFTTPEIEHFEPCTMLLYKGSQDKAITVMDGPQGVSLYPFYEEGVVSLTAVEHTPLGKCETIKEARELVESFNSDKLIQSHIKELMEERAVHYMPWFLNEYEFLRCITAIRVKPKSSTDRRSTIVSSSEDIITVFPGKISGVFEAEIAVLAKLYKEALC